MCGDGLGVVQNGLALSHIEGLGVHLGPGLADQALGGGQAGGVDVGDGQLGTLAGKLHGQFAADARTCAGDHDDFVAEVFHVVLLK